MTYNADRLWALMKTQGRTITWLAKATGYNRTYLHLMRNGSKPVTEEFMRKASVAIGLPTELLFSQIDLTNVSKKVLADSERVAD